MVARLFLPFGIRVGLVDHWLTSLGGVFAPSAATGVTAGGAFSFQEQYTTSFDSLTAFVAEYSIQHCRLANYIS